VVRQVVVVAAARVVLPAAAHLRNNS